MRKVVLIYFILFVLAPLVRADEKTGEEIRRQVISSGSNKEDSSANYKLSGTVAQTVIGSGNSANHTLGHGFWQSFGIAPCDCQPGNVNADSVINIFDITYLIGHLYIDGPPPIPYELCSGDPNNDCTCNIFDITYLIGFLYISGPPPGSCEEWISVCGPFLDK